MYAQITAHAMPGAMIEIKARLPKRMPGQHVKLTTRGSLREACCGNGNMAFQHTGEAIAHLVRRRSYSNGARDIRRPVKILRARIHQIELPDTHFSIGLRLNLIVNDGPVWTRTRDRIKA